MLRQTLNSWYNPKQCMCLESSMQWQSWVVIKRQRRKVTIMSVMTVKIWDDRGKYLKEKPFPRWHADFWVNMSWVYSIPKYASMFYSFFWPLWHCYVFDLLNNSRGCFSYFTVLLTPELEAMLIVYACLTCVEFSLSFLYVEQCVARNMQCVGLSFLVAINNVVWKQGSYLCNVITLHVTSFRYWRGNSKGFCFS